jgi:lipoprotein-anchoring transpeptidase ErfK/SrfK
MPSTATTTTPTVTSPTTSSTTDSRRPAHQTPAPGSLRGRLRRAAGALLLLAAIASLAACGPARSASETGFASGGTVGGAAVELAPSSTNVQSAGGPVAVYADPSAPAPTSTLGPTTSLGSTTTLLVLDRRDGWYHVALPTRPNGSTGWVRAADVVEHTNDVAITVDTGAHTMTVRRAGHVVLQAPVAIGSDANRTPTGTFYVTDLVQPPDPAGAYGPFALGLSAHSETIESFAGGDGQVGIHGTNDPSSIGRSVSHGCVRVGNEIITSLAGIAPLGTPVTIG